MALPAPELIGVSSVRWPFGGGSSRGSDARSRSAVALRGTAFERLGWPLLGCCGLPEASVTGGCLVLHPPTLLGWSGRTEALVPQPVKARREIRSAQLLGLNDVVMVPSSRSLVVSSRYAAIGPTRFSSVKRAPAPVSVTKTVTVARSAAATCDRAFLLGGTACSASTLHPRSDDQFRAAPPMAGMPIRNTPRRRLKPEAFKRVGVRVQVLSE